MTGIFLTIYMSIGMLATGAALWGHRFLMRHGHHTSELRQSQDVLDRFGVPFVLAVGTLFWPALLAIMIKGRSR